MAPPPRILVVQHLPDGPPDAHDHELATRRLPVTRVRLNEGDALPAWQEFDAIVATGGPMSAVDDARYPWLTGERTLIAEAVEAGTPFWGVCLGAQLLAVALGGAVWQGPAPEAGMIEIELTPATVSDPVFDCLPARLLSFAWHRDAMSLPHAATLLASTAAYPVQAFAYRRAYGVQFHLEADPTVLEFWLERATLVGPNTAMVAPAALPAIRRSLEQASPRAVACARKLLARWLDLVVAPTQLTGSTVGSAPTTEAPR